jgi:hypothetical protein
MKEKCCSTCKDGDCEYHPDWADEDMDFDSRLRYNHIHRFTKLKGCASHTSMRDVCKHWKKKICSNPEDPTCASAECPDCGMTFGWWCPKSSDGECHYSVDFDSCDYCGMPEERK